ncbi:MAG TPA: trypsin-like peptidase domain-containing protein [Tepidisphaeraceae bacterium]|nr:trypsin-like peptidase domain-containing protein [Tepidisphaeraceae bacterium]
MNQPSTATRAPAGRWVRRMGVVALALTLALGTYSGINWLVRDVSFARAQADVEHARRALANVQDMAEVFKTVGRAVEPSVVNIQVMRRVSSVSGPGGMPFDDEFLRRFFPDRDGDGRPDVPEQVERSNGSGVIMDVDDGYGYILTNNHVAGGATELLITLADGREIREARVLGVDPKSDLAVIRIKAPRLIPAPWGDSDSLEKGDIVLAFGSPFGFVGSMTQGIVSAKNRQAGIIGSEFAYEDFLQVDAPINPGNSGGPLVNLRGEVVGINTAIASRSGGFQGIGFSIPSNQAKMVYDQLKEKGRVIRGWLGVEIVDVRRLPDEQRSAMGYDSLEGVFVGGVQRGTPAMGRLNAGDIIVSLDGQPTEEARTLTIGEQPDDTTRLAQAPAPAPKQTTAESIGLRLATANPRQLEQLGLSADTGGAVIRGVAPNSLAARAGLQPGDIIVGVGGKRVADAVEAAEALNGVDLSRGVRLNVVTPTGERVLFLQTR